MQEAGSPTLESDYGRFRSSTSRTCHLSILKRISYYYYPLPSDVSNLFLSLHFYFYFILVGLLSALGWERQELMREVCEICLHGIGKTWDKINAKGTSDDSTSKSTGNKIHKRIQYEGTTKIYLWWNSANQVIITVKELRDDKEKLVSILVV